MNITLRIEAHLDEASIAPKEPSASKRAAAIEQAVASVLSGLAQEGSRLVATARKNDLVITHASVSASAQSVPGSHVTVPTPAVVTFGAEATEPATEAAPQEALP